MTRCGAELVQTTGEDGLVHTGALFLPRGRPTRSLAVLWFHGGGSNFHHPSYLTLGHHLSAQGYVFVTGNVRGHDHVAMQPLRDGGIAGGGVAFEVFEESYRDIGAWVNFVVTVPPSLGVQRVALAGTSLSGLRIPYYQARTQDPRVAGIALVGAPLGFGTPRDPYARDPAALALAERMLGEGRGDALLPPETSPDDRPLSARTYVSLARSNTFGFGLDAPAPAIAQVRCPILAIYGAEDREPVNYPPEEMLALIRRQARVARRVDTRLLPGIGHGFGGHEPAVAAAIAEWAHTLERDDVR